MNQNTQISLMLSFHVDFEKAQIIAVTRRIRELRGVVSAEDLAPYLNPPKFDPSSQSVIVNESWMLNVVLSLGGTPVVTENGNIAYVFEVRRITRDLIHRQ